MINNYRAFIFCLTVFLSVVGCESAVRQSAIDGRVSLSRASDATALLSLAQQERIESIIVTPQLSFKPGEATVLDPNDSVWGAAKQNPGKFIPFPQLNLSDPQRLTQFNALVQAGAKGLVLLPAPIEDSLYSEIAARHLPVLFPVVGKNDLPVLSRILANNPTLSVICAELCGLTNRLDQLAALLSRYPNLYVDFGFSDAMLEKSILHISQDPAALRALIEKNPTRFIFSSGLSVTPQLAADLNLIPERLRGYRRLFEKAHYDFPLLTRRFKNRGLRFPNDGAFYGLFLAPETIAKVYRENILQLLKSL